MRNTKAKILIAVALMAVLTAAVMAQGCRAAQVGNRLPVHTFTPPAHHLVTGDINPAAIDEIQKIHTMGGIPSEYPALTVLVHSEVRPVREAMRSTIQMAGGASTIECHRRGVSVSRCALHSAVPTQMMESMGRLEHASFHDLQAWLDQPRDWTQSQPVNEFALTTIEFRLAEMSMWPLRANHVNLQVFGTLIVMAASGVMLALVTAAGATGFAWAVERERERESMK